MSGTNGHGKYKELLINIGIFSLASLLSKAIMFFLLPLYTNVLSPAEYGTVELIMTGINLLTPIFTLSISDAVVRFGLDSRIDHGHVLKAETVFLVGSSLVMIACYPLLHLYRPLEGYTWIFIFAMIVLMFRSNYTFYLKSINNNKLFAIDSIIYTLVLAGSNILFLVGLKMGIAGYMLSLIVASLISIVFVLLVGHGLRDLRISPFDKKLLKDMVAYSAPMVFNALSWWITNSSDKYMLEYFWSSSEVGIYSAAAKIPALITTVNALFSQAWTLSSVKEYEHSKDKSFFKNIFSMYSFVMFLATAAILLIVKPFMNIYVGSDFNTSWYYVPALLIASLYGCFSNYFGSIYIAAKQNIKCTLSTIICGIVNIVLNFALIPKYGIWGATIATAISFIIVGVYRMVDCQRLFYFPIDYWKYGVASVLVVADSILIIHSRFRYLISSFVILIIIIVYKNEVSAVLRTIRNSIQRRKD